MAAGAHRENFRDGRLAALRLGRTLAAEVPATDTERRAFILVRPLPDQDDTAAAVEGWTRQVPDRTFHVRHEEFRIEHLDGYDHDIGMVRVADATVRGEHALLRLLERWRLPPGELDHLWNTDHP